MARIFISAGHYDRDPGASSASGTTEALEMIQTRDLMITELTARGLQENRDFFSVPDTINLRPTITWINERAVAGDVALEIHGNAFNRRVRGTECFYIEGNEERRRDARLMLNSLLREVPELSDRGAKRDTLAAVGSLGFCRRISVASLLLELCFIDNSEDLELLQTRRDDFAKGIVDGLIAWSGITARGGGRNDSGRGGNGSYPIINVELGGVLYEDRGILVNNNAFIPLSLAERLGVTLDDVRRVTQGGVVYVKAVDLQPFNVSIAWNGTTRTVIVDAELVSVEINVMMKRGLASATDLSNFLAENNSGDFANRFPNIGQLYVEEARKEGVNHDIAFCQMLLETGYLRFGGDVSPDQNNFCGLGAVGGGAAGASFPDAKTGVKAHIEHLKAYASTDPINELPIVDPRFDLVTRGVAPTVEQLAGRWAVDPDYGTKILTIVRRLYERADIELHSHADPKDQLLAFTSPGPGSNFELNETFTVRGTAPAQVAKVGLTTPYGGNVYPLITVDVTGGTWQADVMFNTAGDRTIIATALDADDNLLEYEPEELIVVIAGNTVTPVQGGYITSKYGWRIHPITRRRTFHRGTDIGHAGRTGTPIRAIAAGTVSRVQTGCRVGASRCGGGFGNFVYISHTGLGYQGIYAHLNTVNVSNGDTVTPGQVIGTMGSTGFGNGPHLHIETRRLSNTSIHVNPADVIKPIV